MLNDTPALQVDLVRRLHCAAGHLQGIAGMVEGGANCESLVRQTLAVQAALRQVNRLILKYHFEVCLAHCLQETGPNSEDREHCCAEVVALYHLLNG